MPNTHETAQYDIQIFLKDNLPIITIIGVFAAISKYFSEVGNNSSQDVLSNEALLSLLTIIVTIFLLIIFVVITILHLHNRFKENIKKRFLLFLYSSLSDIAIGLFCFFIFFIVLTMMNILNLAYSAIDLKTIFVILISCLGFLVAIYLVLYLLFKVHNHSHILAIFLISVISFWLSEIYLHFPPSKFDFTSPLAPLEGLIIILIFIFYAAFIKLIYFELKYYILPFVPQIKKFIMTKFNNKK